MKDCEVFHTKFVQHRKHLVDSLEINLKATRFKNQSEQLSERKKDEQIPAAHSLGKRRKP